MADGGSDVQLAGRELARGLHMSVPSPKHLSDVIVQRLALPEGGEQRPVSCCDEAPGLEHSGFSNYGDQLCFGLNQD